MYITTHPGEYKPCVYHTFATQVAAQFQLVAIVTVASTLHVHCIDTSK